MDRMIKPKRFKTLLPYFLLALAIIGSYRVISDFHLFANVIRQMWGIVKPFFYGFILAYILNMPCNGIEKLLDKSKIKFIIKRKRGFSVTVLYIIIVQIFLLLLNLIVPVVSNSASLFATNFPAYYESTLQFIEYINSLDILGIYISLDWLIGVFQEMWGYFSFENLIMSINALVSVSSAIFSGFLAVVSSIYILLEKDKMKAFIGRMLKTLTADGFSSTILKYTDSLNKNVKQYIRTQTIDGCILGTIVTIELYLLGSPYFLVLGIMLGIVNYIPYFGSIIGSLIAIIIVAFTQGIATGAIAAVVLLITQQIDGNFIQPKLMSGSFSLSPFLVIVSVTIGGGVGGIMGMIVAIPIVAVLKDIVESVLEFFEHRKSKQDLPVDAQIKIKG